MREPAIRSMQSILKQRTAECQRVSQPLPGSKPYDNLRPINIPGRFDGRILFDSVCEMYPQVPTQQWCEWFALGHILRDGEVAEPDQLVRAGEQFWHCFPGTIEPDVNPQIRVIWEDDSLVGISKPAPLPCHPCGRFNRNTLIWLLDKVYGKDELRLVHRLDANTSGVLVLARSPSIATNLRQQFDSGTPNKRYLARIVGEPTCDAFACDMAISKERSAAGARQIDSQGQSARTEFRVMKRYPDSTTLVEAKPLTGRTNQIRIHLWSLGMPVLGDPTYLTKNRIASQQTLTPDCPPMCLHASSLSLEHPRGMQPITLSDVAPDWAA